MSESNKIDGIEKKGRSSIEAVGTLLAKLKNRDTRNPIIVGTVCTLFGWLISDGRVFEYIEPKLKTSCFEAKTYPLGKWNYTAELPSGNLKYFLYNSWFFESKNTGHVPSDISLQGQFEFLGDFKFNSQLRMAYRDERSYCSVGFFNLSEDGCSMDGHSQGYHPGGSRSWDLELVGKYKGCPAGFPFVESTQPSQRTDVTSAWKGRRPYVWEFWNKK